MKGYMILGEPVVETEMRYRGTYRVSPTYEESLESESKLNEFFRWYVSDGGETGIVHDLQRAIRYLHEYQMQKGRNTFEIVSVSDDPNASPDGELLGYDLSCGFHYSLLSWGLNFKNSTTEPQSVGVLLELTADYFKPKLNSRGLFGSRSDAEYCLNCLAALQQVSPNLLEGGDQFAFEVVGLGMPQVERK